MGQKWKAGREFRKLMQSSRPGLVMAWTREVTVKEVRHSWILDTS